MSIVIESRQAADNTLKNHLSHNLPKKAVPPFNNIVQDILSSPTKQRNLSVTIDGGPVGSLSKHDNQHLSSIEKASRALEKDPITANDLSRSRFARHKNGTNQDVFMGMGQYAQL